MKDIDVNFANINTDTNSAEPKSEPIFINLPRQGGNAQQDAFNIRENFKVFFNSPSGEVPWQQNQFL